MPPDDRGIQPDDLRRLEAQRLAPRHAGDVASLVSALSGVQAQDAAAAALALRARTVGLTAADVERALTVERSIVRTWAMRGTLHFVAATDARWLLALLGPRLAAAGRRRRGELRLDDAASARGVAVIRDALARRGAQTRAEIAAELGTAAIPHQGQATVHLLALATFEGYVCHGPTRDGEPTYVLTDSWLPRAAAAPADPIAELARRYRGSHRPATVADFAHWSGLAQADARAGWSAISDESPVRDGDSPELPVVRLLPAYDEYLLGWSDRTHAVPREHTRRVHPGGGLIRPVVLVDGRAVGTWRLVARGRRREVAVAPFAMVTTTMRDALETEAAEVGRFLGQSVALRFA